MNFEWKVDHIDKNADGIATFAAFRVIARDDAGRMGVESGAVDLLPIADGHDVIPFDDLTDEQKVQMVKDGLSLPHKDAPEVFEARAAANAS